MARKEDKLRPYRVDYFNIDEMKEVDQVLVRSVVVRAVTAAEAAGKVLTDNETLPIILIRSYRFYKQIGAHKKDVFKAVEDLFSEKQAVIVMEEVEKYRAQTVPVVPDHATPDPAFGVDKATFYKNSAGTTIQPPTSGPDSPATVAVVADLNGMLSNDAHEQTMATFVPDNVPEGKRFPDPSNAPITGAAVAAAVAASADKPLDVFGHYHQVPGSDAIVPASAENVEVIEPDQPVGQESRPMYEGGCCPDAGNDSFFRDPFTYVVLTAAAIIIYGLFRFFSHLPH